MFPRYACRPLRSVSVSTPSNPFSLSLSLSLSLCSPSNRSCPCCPSAFLRELPYRPPLSSSLIQLPSRARRLAFHEQVVCFNGSSTLRLAFLCTSLKGRRIAARCYGSAICAGGVAKAFVFLFFDFTPLPLPPLLPPPSTLLSSSSFFFARLSSFRSPPPLRSPAASRPREHREFNPRAFRGAPPNFIGENSALFTHAIVDAEFSAARKRWPLPIPVIPRARPSATSGRAVSTPDRGIGSRTFGRLANVENADRRSSLTEKKIDTRKFRAEGNNLLLLSDLSQNFHPREGREDSPLDTGIKV